MDKPPKLIPQLSEKDKQRFFARIQPQDSGCHIFSGYTDQDGYSEIKIERKGYKSHRVAFFLATGQQPGGLCVCHTCDNTGCVNPEHLFLGSYLDNNRDRDTKGRANPARGKSHWQSALTDEDVVNMRAEHKRGGVTKASLAIKYKVSQANVYLITTHQAWAHLSTPEDLANVKVRVKRSLPPLQAGKQPACAVLNVEQVLEIRAKWELGKSTKVQLAKEYGVCAHTVSMIVTRKTWRHI